MSFLLHKEIDQLKKRLYALSAVVEGRVEQALQALLEGDRELALKVARGDAEIDNLEIALEEECLKIMALYQPVASDLRFLVSVLKINNDLERVADFAVNLAERSLDLGSPERVRCPYDLRKMARSVQEIFHTALDSVMHQDAALARRAIAMDDLVDSMHRENYCRVKDAIVKDITAIDAYVLYLSISRYLERMGDLATNIAEDVVYHTEGDIIRHGGVQTEG